MNGSYRQGDVVLGNWTLGRKIGEGSFGQVFEATREDFGVTYRAAIKIITIPQSESEIKSARSEGLDDGSITSYFRSFVEEIVQEFVLMSKLKGNSNIVSYEDHTVLEHQDGIGWDIIIRMELLTPLLDHMQKQPMSRQDVVKLGIDITRALELCQKHNIVHRDIKPENIFVSEAGDYKLGDFGIARTVEKTTGGLSKKGTYTYMAPEVYKDEPYGPSVDIYSLGLVMYRLLNENRAPFLPPYPAPITHSDRENAMVQRISGARIPAPKDADERLARIVLKACAYQPRERYSGPAQMRGELEAILNEGAQPADAWAANDRTVSGFASPEPAPAPYPAPAQPQQSYGAERTSSVFGGQPTAAKAPAPAPAPAPTAGGPYQLEPTVSDRTQSVFGGTAPVQQAAAASNAPAFVPKGKTAPQKTPVRKLLLGIGVPVLVFAVVFLVARGMSGRKPAAGPVPGGSDTTTATVGDEVWGNPSYKQGEPYILLNTTTMLVGTSATPMLMAPYNDGYQALYGTGQADEVFSSDPAVLAVDEARGCVTALAPGAVTLTMIKDGQTAEYRLKVCESTDSVAVTIDPDYQDGGMDSRLYPLSPSGNGFTVMAYSDGEELNTVYVDNDGNLYVYMGDNDSMDVTVVVAEYEGGLTIAGAATIHVTR